MTLLEAAQKLLELEKKSTETCITCGSRVSIYSSGEGTNSYVPIPFQPEIARALIKAVGALEFYASGKSEWSEHVPEVKSPGALARQALKEING
jgi:predicted metal-binding protein